MDKHEKGKMQIRKSTHKSNFFNFPAFRTLKLTHNNDLHKLDGATDIGGSFTWLERTF